jgi:uncharacterized UBP type Zn finger protein
MIQTLSTIGSNSSMRPMGFWRTFHDAVQDSCFEHLQQRQPHDAHEFLMFLLDSLHESLSKKVNMNITDIYTVFRRKGYETTFIPWYINIFGIRGYCEGKWNKNEVDYFNDTLGIMFADEEKNYTCLLCSSLSLKFMRPCPLYMEKTLRERPSNGLLPSLPMD